MPNIRLFAALLMVAAFLATVAALAQTPGGEPLTSVAIDPTLYRDGAIKRYSGSREAWSYVCDEVAKLNKRFCSLRSLIKDREGRVIAALTVSTGEDGRPAALLRMPSASFSQTGIEVWAKPAAPDKAAGKAKTKPPAVTRLYPAACTVDVCEMVWTLPPDHIGALNSGAGLQLRYTEPKPGTSQLAAAIKPPEGRATEVSVSGQGFAAAVTASVTPGG